MRLRISGALLRFTDYQSVIEVEASTVEAALLQLAEAHAPFRKVLLDRAGRVRATHKIFLNGEQLAPDQLAHPARASDQVDLITAISGG
jgi:molybdopterin converting factor small subunit